MRLQTEYKADKLVYVENYAQAKGRHRLLRPDGHDEAASSR